jgi:uncharacterized protein
MTRALPASEIALRVGRVDWERAAAELDAHGHARVPGLLDEGECRALAALWDEPARFRKRIDLAQHRFGGGGAYQYFAYPLPGPVEALRRALYPPLARIANAWQERLGAAPGFPPTHERFLARCRRERQTRPTPLLLRYGRDGYNRMHQDVYGAVAFPLQVAFLLSRPGRDFRGGEFVLVEQRPREQARVEAIDLEQGEAVVFPNQARPVAGRRGSHRVQVRHGVSRVRDGDRVTLGVIFHDAR